MNRKEITAHIKNPNYPGFPSRNLALIFPTSVLESEDSLGVSIVPHQLSDGRVAQPCLCFPGAIPEPSSASQGVSVLSISISFPGFPLARDVPHHFPRPMDLLLPSLALFGKVCVMCIIDVFILPHTGPTGSWLQLVS